MTEPAVCALAGFEEEMSVSLDLYIEYVQMYSLDVTIVPISKSICRYNVCPVCQMGPSSEASPIFSCCFLSDRGGHMLPKNLEAKFVICGN